MKTERVLETKQVLVTVEVRYWTCLNPDHRHKTRAVAAGCIAKTEKKLNSAPPRRWNQEMHMKVIEQRDIDGMTFKAIGDSLGVSRSRGQSVYEKACRLYKNNT